ncbi:MAG: c-type cytochrome, partial [Myxococcota bacterium]
SVEVGLEPTRLARAGDRIFVTLRASRAVGVLEDRGGTLVRVDTLEVGAEPYGIVAREDGEKLYVALSAQDQVAEIDAATLSVTRTFDVGGQPAFLALHPSGKALYVGSSMGGAVTFVDLDDGAVKELDLPAIYGAGEDGSKQFTRRITGDFSVAPDGSSFAAPALFVDNDNPVADPGETEVQSDGYGSVGVGVSRFNPSVVIVPTDDNGNPKPDEAATVLVAGFAELREDGGDSTAVRSYLSSATYSPRGDLIYATMEASEAVAVVSATPIYPSAEDEVFFDTAGTFVSADQAGFASSPLLFVGVDHGPKGVAFLSEDAAYVHSWLDRTVGSLGARRVQESFGEQVASGFLTSDTFKADPGTVVAEGVLDADIEAGRRLFYSATSSQMAADGAGISCSTCHFDGRNDGVTWTFEDGVRQTPSLAGQVSATAPFTWTLQVETVGDEAQITSSGRMGGNGLSYAEAAQVAAYIESIRAVDLPMKGSTDAAVLRGKAIFERADTACSSCHSGERFTDNGHYAMFGLEAVNTPALVGVAATAPYLHNGAAPTLESVLELSRSGEMGDTSMLSDAEMSDLAAYLRSL